MVNLGRKKSQIRSRIFIGLAVVSAAVVLVLGMLWNRYLNKNSLIEKYKSPQEQEVYLLGTLHENHFNKWVHYSMEDILSAVNYVDPGVVLLEAREEYLEGYGVMDGPIDMAVVYSYCMDNDIPVEMVDWWVVDNKYQSNTTSAKRDDMIFANIDNKIKAMNADTKVLVICGAGHFYEQSKRFLNSGFEKQKIENRASYFKRKEKNFEYPVSVENVWEKRAYFYAYIYPEIISKDETLDCSTKSEFTEGNHDAFYNQQLKYCELFSKNELYK